LIKNTDSDQAKQKVDNYYSNVENIMRNNNVGFFSSDVLAGKNTYKPVDRHFKSQQPVVNETNYNVHLKDNNGIVNINLINNSADMSMFTGSLPKSQGVAKAEEMSSGYRPSKKSANSSSLPRKIIKGTRKVNHQNSITITTKSRK